MLINNEMVNDVKAMALSFSYTDEIDENYEDSDLLLPNDEDDFASFNDDTLSKFDDDFDETIDNSIEDSDYEDEGLDFDSSDEMTEDYSDED
ncbi:hypothetical protein [uncultured Treponema sp.]|uniref:hypothetical protein n=1 Tax=uncultured Treponema sp. TaxID=162155 RepID=UPI0025E4C071|nr:hypothetical protein [uncultured Treponema sp.]